MFVERVLACLKVQFHHLPVEPEENYGRVKQDLVPGVVSVSHELRLLSHTITRKTVAACNFVYWKLAAITNILVCFHRVILSACSPYFRAMFNGELAESWQTEVTVQDIDEVAFGTLEWFLLHFTHCCWGGKSTNTSTGRWIGIWWCHYKHMVNKCGWTLFCADVFRYLLIVYCEAEKKIS